MTRDKAIAIVTLVDAFVELGMLKLDDPEEKDRLAAIDRLHHSFIHDYGGAVVKLSRDSAAEILDILLKSGFKITR